MILMEGEFLRMLFWETKAVVRTFAHFLLIQLADTHSSSFHEDMS
jgi:hypothetical protein